MSSDGLHDLAIAVVGLAGRFPGARNVDEYWSNLCGGVDSLTRISDADLASSGVPEATRTDPAYVPFSGVLEGIDLFDAPFFGFSPREAELIDPQRRLLMECCWEGLEHAGYDPSRYSGPIGLFAGTSFNGYLLFNVLASARALGEDPFDLQIASDKDFLATHISYKLDLRGPSLDIQTACSTSLVAVHVACQSLLAGECDMALAGGVCVRVPHRIGHLHRRGSILSIDGRCRAFDEGASGTVGGNGAGVVVLKRLVDAIEARDTIHAVIRGSATNNDGGVKAGFSAPSVEGQTRVVRAALAVAEVDASSIGYVEAHGTGTALGDPIEIAALTQAFRGSGAAPMSCAIGSVKTNIGHLDAAAGIAGFIKAALSVRDGRIAPTLHFERPNPHLGIAGGPFFVNTALREWPVAGTRRAGVSSFGIGGTNAHVILEQAPSPSPAERSSRSWTLLPLSARSPSAREAMSVRLADSLKKDPDADLADVAYTLAVGRRAFDFRRAVICRGAAEAIDALERLDPSRIVDGYVSGERPVVFMFPGQGAQHEDMGLELYRTEPVFAEIVDTCASHLRRLLGFDLRTLLYPSRFAPTGGAVRDPAPAHRLDQTFVAQPALFVTSYAMARTWIAHGLRPSALIGHSVGELVAACLSGVLALEDALDLVAERGRLMQRLAPGGMLAVSASAVDAEGVARIAPGVVVAAANAPTLTVLSGPLSGIDAIALEFDRRGIATRRLHTSHAFHSPMMDDAMAPLAEAARRVDRREPTLRYISNVSGTWITPQEATDPEYFARHLRSPVLFGAGIERIREEEPDAIFLEVGPGRTLGSLVRASQPTPVVRDTRAPSLVVASMPRPTESAASDSFPRALAELWTNGAAVDPAAAYAQEARRRVALPTYPFERERYWIEAGGRGRFLLGTPGSAPEEGAAATDRASERAPRVPTPAGARHARPTLRTPYVAPESDVEKQLTAVWEEALGLEGIGAHDHFIELGGHSLLGARIAVRLREVFSVELPLPVLFESPTIAQLAIAIEDAVITQLEQRGAS